MRKKIFAAFAAALSIFAAVPSYARVWEEHPNYYNGISEVGWYHDGTGWRYNGMHEHDHYGWVWSKGRLYHLDRYTGYCNLDTTVSIQGERGAFKYGKFTFDKTGALTDNGEVVDVGHKDGEFNFLTMGLDADFHDKFIFNRNCAQETEEKALALGIKPTGEKIYSNTMSDDNYIGWVVAAPGFTYVLNQVYFYDETADHATTLGKMKENPNHTYSLKLMVVGDNVDSANFANFTGIISPTSYLVPAGFLPTL